MMLLPSLADLAFLDSFRIDCQYIKRFSLVWINLIHYKVEI